MMANRLLSVLFLGFHDEKNREISKFQTKKKSTKCGQGACVNGRARMESPDWKKNKQTKKCVV